MVELLSTTGTLLASYSGSNFTTSANGNTQQANTNRRVTVKVDPSDPLIGGIRFKSAGNSLEVDNIVFSVPEPSVWMLMLLGFAMVAGATRYRRRSTQVVFAEPDPWGRLSGRPRVLATFQKAGHDPAMAKTRPVRGATTTARATASTCRSARSTETGVMRRRWSTIRHRHCAPA